MVSWQAKKSRYLSQESRFPNHHTLQPPTRTIPFSNQLSGRRTPSQASITPIKHYRKFRSHSRAHSIPASLASTINQGLATTTAGENQILSAVQLIYRFSNNCTALYHDASETDPVLPVSTLNPSSRSILPEPPRTYSPRAPCPVHSIPWPLAPS